MKPLHIVIEPLTSFGTPLAGDTLFGHLCWAVSLRHGRDALQTLLDGYTQGRPWVVTSDAFPAGWLPRPTLPDSVSGLEVDDKDRKAFKRVSWLPAEQRHLPIADWVRAAARSPNADPGARNSNSAPTPEAGQAITLTQNSINRLTGTTGTGPFAPRQVQQIQYVSGTRLDVYAVLDTERFHEADFRVLLDDIGLAGFGRDASTGLGKFRVASLSAGAPPAVCTHAMALAPCAFNPSEIEPEGCWWLPITRFGRHGNMAAQGADPFKRPVMQARTGAIICWRTPGAHSWHGQGVGGVDQAISSAIPATVHQGYAPVVAIRLGPQS